MPRVGNEREQTGLPISLRVKTVSSSLHTVSPYSPPQQLPTATPAFLRSLHAEHRLVLRSCIISPHLSWNVFLFCVLPCPPSPLAGLSLTTTWKSANHHPCLIFISRRIRLLAFHILYYIFFLLMVPFPLGRRAPMWFFSLLYLPVLCLLLLLPDSIQFTHSFKPITELLALQKSRFKVYPSELM